MRILFLSNYYPPFEIGGYEQLCRDVAVRLAERGHTIAVLTSNRGAARGRGDTEPGIRRVLRIQPDYGARLSPAAQFFLTRRQTEAHNRRACQDMLRRFHPDVVFIWNLDGLPNELAADVEALEGVAAAYWLAGYTPAEPDSYWRYWTQPPNQRTALGRVKGVLCRVALGQMRHEGKPVRLQMRHVAVVSEYMRQKGITEGTLPVHAHVIYNGVEVEQFLHPVPETVEGNLNLLQAGRVSTDKGVHVAVEAVGRLSHSDPGLDIHLFIAGSGRADYLADLHKLIQRYDIGNRVSFLGWLPREQMPALLEHCHVLLLPTIHQEPFARVVLEAMAGGLAVVAARTGGSGEIIEHDVTGLLSAPSDDADLAAQIRRLLVEPGLRRRLATEGQRRVLERFNLDRMVEDLEMLLQEAVADRQGPG